jgi:hypothetical protein
MVIKIQRKAKRTFDLLFDFYIKDFMYSILRSIVWFSSICCYKNKLENEWYHILSIFQCSLPSGNM